MAHCDQCKRWACTSCMEMEDFADSLDDYFYFCHTCMEYIESEEYNAKVIAAQNYLLVAKNKSLKC